MDLQAIASQLALRVALFLLALVLCGAVLVLGLNYLAQTLYQALLPVSNATVASGVTALLCLSPAICLLIALARRSRGPVADDHRNDSVRELVRENPWETLGAVFILGVSQSSRSPLDPDMLKRLIALLEQDKKDSTPEG